MLVLQKKYFRKFYSLIDKLPKSNDCRANVSNVTSHLIAKLEEKYGRLEPTTTREDIVHSPEQRSMLLQRINGSDHFRYLLPFDNFEIVEMITRRIIWSCL